MYIFDVQEKKWAQIHLNFKFIESKKDIKIYMEKQKNVQEKLCDHLET